ncbi:hypothetical protein [Planomonospora venezuelensis]|uniref:Uncharacterized protein n=1 Tax=Planomonospora venezuelensis TaxID=1999 RepID=A0A841D8N0_PLAVE|nr:hypothetical protein [Planomonospora venezuelensis]MBB5966992.1 hypothetical protein [Planomonospora venezuelensis]GIN01539.1 hypothetical protein Pve01_31970 [Planomonospora venezuelensis]
MNPTRKMWVSAGVVAAVLVGGVSVSAAASAGRLEKDGRPSPATEPHQPASQKTPVPPAPAETAPPAEDFVVSKEVNPDPEQVTRYWTEHRMEEAEPMPMPGFEGTGEGAWRPTE